MIARIAPPGALLAFLFKRDDATADFSVGNGEDGVDEAGGELMLMGQAPVRECPGIARADRSQD